MLEYFIKDGELYHHGVKGMKWGKRKAHPTNQPANNTKKINNSTSKKNVKSINKGSTTAKKSMRKIKNKPVNEIKPSDYPLALQTVKAMYERKMVYDITGDIFDYFYK